MTKATLRIMFGIVFLFLAVPENGFASEKLFTIGIVNAVSTHTPTIEGFIAGMAELGYVEGKNVDYVYRGTIDHTDRAMDAEIQRLVSLKIDLLVTAANEPAIRAKELLGESDLPVLAVACAKMVEEGIVKDLKVPRGNITGIQVPESQWKALEWFTIIVPDAEKILIMYNPDDEASTIHLPGLRQTASKLGVTLVLKEVRSLEEAVKVIEALPPDIGALFQIPSQTLSPFWFELNEAALKQGLPLGASVPLDETVLMSFGSDFFEMGKQSARLADQIRKGINPSDLPVEIAEAFLYINVTTAEKIGLEIPNSILALAKKIMR